MDTKAAFEKFREWWFAPEQMEIRLNVAEGWGFKIWLASRAAIEIELPEEFHSESWLGNGCCDDYANTKIAECRKAITSHGIRINGKTE